jgi:hypothetical protein
MLIVGVSGHRFIMTFQVLLKVQGLGGHDLGRSTQMRKLNTILLGRATLTRTTGVYGLEAEVAGTNGRHGACQASYDQPRQAGMLAIDSDGASAISSLSPLPAMTTRLYRRSFELPVGLG